MEDGSSAVDGSGLRRSHYLVLVPAVLLLSVIFLKPAAVRGGFGVLLDNLPLTLPVLSVLMAVLLDPRELGRLEGWLKLTPHFALGLVSFAIWYFVASQGVSGYIAISSRRVLTTDFSFLLLISAFIWAGYSSVVAIIAESRTNGSPRWQAMRLLNLGLSAALLLLPFGLFEDKKAVEDHIGASLDLIPFSVAVPYRDPALNQHLGRSTDPLTLVYTFAAVSARTADDASRIAADSFLALPESRQFVQPTQRGLPDSARRSVEVLFAQVVAQPAARQSVSLATGGRVVP